MLHNNLPRSFATSAKDGLMSAEDKELISTIIPKQIENNRADINYLLEADDYIKNERIPEVEDLANLALQTALDKVSAITFDTKADLDAWMAIAENVSGLKVGTTLLVKELETPDYWWDGEELQILETQKVDLTDYLEKTGNASDATVTYTEATTLSKPTSGSKLGTIFSILTKAVGDLIGLISKVGSTDISDSGSTVTEAVSNISKTYLKLSGGKMTGDINMGGKRLNEAAGIYTDTANVRYSNSGVVIRENGLVGATQSTIGYAPSIGFHWAGVVAATLLMDNSGDFNFMAQNGVNYASIKCNAINSSGWFKSTGKTGWTNDTYGGGIYMEDTTYVRVSGGKSFYCANTIKAGSNIESPAIELISATPFIDFHYASSTADYTSRIIENASGQLNINGVSFSNSNVSTSGTITGGKVYNAVWNDYAEWFEKEDLDEDFEAGDIVSWVESGVTKSNSYGDTMVVGVYSDSYGHIVGGESLEDMEDNHKKFVPVGLAGRLNVKVTGKVKRGDLIVSSDIPGVGIAQDKYINIPGTVIGKSLQDKDTDDIGKVKILIMIS